MLRERFIRFARPWEAPVLLPEEVRVSIQGHLVNSRIKPGSFIMVEVSIENDSAVPLISAGAMPVHASYHWRDGAGHTIVHDGVRTPLNVPAGCARKVEVRVFAPPKPGIYQLVITLVKEGCFWFDASTPNVKWTARVVVLE
jgi:hypothetical protein